MDCQSPEVDLAFAFLARGHFIATDFEWRVLVRRVTPCAPLVRRAKDCPPYQRRGLSELIGVGKSLQNRVMTCGAEIFQYAPKYWIQQNACVSHIKIERHQLAIQMQLRLVV